MRASTEPPTSKPTQQAGLQHRGQSGKSKALLLLPPQGLTSAERQPGTLAKETWQPGAFIFALLNTTCEGRLWGAESEQEWLFSDCAPQNEQWGSRSKSGPDFCALGALSSRPAATVQGCCYRAFSSYLWPLCTWQLQQPMAGPWGFLWAPPESTAPARERNPRPDCSCHALQPYHGQAALQLLPQDPVVQQHQQVGGRVHCEGAGTAGSRGAGRRRGGRGGAPQPPTQGWPRGGHPASLIPTELRQLVGIREATCGGRREGDSGVTARG